MKTEIERILIVEDQIELGISIQMHLKRNYFNTDLAVNGMQAYYKIKTSNTSYTPFELVILDYYMPLMDGPDLISHLVKEYPDMSIMLFSGVMTKNAMLANIRKNMDYCCVKPISPHRMLRIISLINQKRQKVMREMSKETLEI